MNFINALSFMVQRIQVKVFIVTCCPVSRILLDRNPLISLLFPVKISLFQRWKDLTLKTFYQKMS